ncbi:MAG: hypothetical protein JNJ83_16675 [Verrucomicrobiaceae bacterium]|nr:hypothetical protein [Verrucomicrobiaceae bacterium]
MTTTTTKTNPPANWPREVRLMVTRNWKVKLLAIVLAFLFWHIVKSEIRQLPLPSFTEEHSLKQSSGL